MYSIHIMKPYFHPFFSDKAHWTEKRGTGDNKRTIHYRNERIYFSQKIVLWGNPLDSNADSPTMPPGDYTLPFQFILPYNIPFSFEGGWGHVRYTCKATIGEFNQKIANVFVRDAIINCAPCGVVVVGGGGVVRVQIKKWLTF